MLGTRPPALAVLLAFCWTTANPHASRAQPSTGGNYPAVTADTVARLRLERYDTPDKKAHPADFRWTFSKDEFVVKKGAGPIPPHLLKLLLPDGATADEVCGRWKLENGGRDLVLTGIKAGNADGNKTVALPIEQTGTGVVRVGAPEYVFGVTDAKDEPAPVPDRFRGSWTHRLTSTDGGKSYVTGDNKVLCEVSDREIKFTRKVEFTDAKLAIKSVKQPEAKGPPTCVIEFENGKVWKLTDLDGSVTVIMHDTEKDKLKETHRIVVRVQGK